MNDPWLLAIDFGTSFTVAAVRSVRQPAEVIEIEGERRMASVLFCAEDGSIVVGRSAEDLARFQPGRSLRAPKSRIGDKPPINLGGRSFPIVDLVAALLGHVRAEAERHMGSAPAEVRLTHPATWSRTRQANLLDAATRAELPHPVLVPEPVAAAVSYAENADMPVGGHVLVYDLGGGTFDTAVLRATEAGFVVVGRPLGEGGLGGELFDEITANLIGERLDPSAWQSLTASDAADWQRAATSLRMEARRAKELLSTQPHVDVLISLPNGLVQQRVTRAELEAQIRPYVEESADLLHRVLDDAEVAPGDVSAIYLAGGGSRTPLVREVLAAEFPEIPISRRGDPKLAVALGATSARATPSDVAIGKPPTSIENPSNPSNPSNPPVPPPPPPKPDTVADLPPRPDRPATPPTIAGGGPPPHGGGGGAGVSPPPPPPPPPSEPRPSAKKWWIAAAALLAVLLIGGGVAWAVSGAGDGDGDETASDTTDDPPRTTRRTTDTTDDGSTTSRGSTSSLSTSTSSSSTTSTTSTTVAPTTTTTAVPPPPPPPPPAEPTPEQLQAALLTPSDFFGNWIALADPVAVPTCLGSTTAFPDTPLEAQRVLINPDTQQSAGNLVQAWPAESDAIAAFSSWQQQFECPAGDDDRILTQLDFGAPLCDDEFYYYSDDIDGQGNILLRSTILAERCGKNISIAYFDENIALDVEESTDIANTTLLNAAYRFIDLPT